MNIKKKKMSQSPKKTTDDDSGNHCAGDTHLKNWTTWMEQRQTMASKLSQKIGRNPQDLVMNAADETRQILEKRTLVQYAKIPTDFDKYRGNPAFWSTPPGFKHICNKNLASGHYVVPTKEDLNIVPSLEQIGVPRRILEEKHVWPRSRNRLTTWKKSQYLAQRNKELEAKITQIRHCKPDFENLIVVGQGGQKSEAPESETLISNEQQPQEVEIIEVEAESTPTLWLSIMGVVINNQEVHHGRRKIRLQFDYEINNSHQTLFLNLENPSQKALRIYWNKLEKFHLFTTEHCHKFDFFFNKNELIILPGHQLAFPVHFKADTPGIFAENWEITTKPPVWSEDFHFIVALHAHAYVAQLKEKIQKKLASIEIRARDTAVKELVNDLLKKLKFGDVPKAPCKYSEAEVFELINSDNKRLQYLFDKAIITELNCLYNQFQTDEGANNWDWSIQTLNMLARRTDLDVFYRNKEVSEVVLIPNKSTSVKLSKPKGKKGKGEVIKSSSNIKTETIVDRESYIYANSDKVCAVVRKLERPAERNNQKEKYWHCFTVLSSYFDKMGKSLKLLDEEFNMSRVSQYPKSENKIVPLEEEPERLIYEYFDCTWKPKPVPTERPYTLLCKPKHLAIREIPLDNCDNIFSAYFNKSPTQLALKGSSSEKTKKKGTGRSKSKGSNKSSKSTKKSKKTATSQKAKKTKSKNTNLPKKRESECFDPYLEEFAFSFDESTNFSHKSSQELVEIKETKELDEVVQDNYNTLKYVLVYNCLSEAVDALVDVANSYECSVSYDTLDEVNKSYFYVNLH